MRVTAPGLSPLPFPLSFQKCGWGFMPFIPTALRPQHSLTSHSPSSRRAPALGQEGPVRCQSPRQGPVFSRGWVPAARQESWPSSLGQRVGGAVGGPLIPMATPSPPRPQFRTRWWGAGGFLGGLGGRGGWHLRRAGGLTVRVGVCLEQSAFSLYHYC